MFSLKSMTKLEDLTVQSYFHTAGGGNVYTLLRKVRNAEKVSPASASLPAINFISPASAFRHQVQSGTNGHGLVRHFTDFTKKG
jgi:hypothetical protein